MEEVCQPRAERAHHARRDQPRRDEVAILGGRVAVRCQKFGRPQRETNGGEQLGPHVERLVVQPEERRLSASSLSCPLVSEVGRGVSLR